MDYPDRMLTRMGVPLAANVLDNAVLPPGDTATVTGWVVQGTTQVLAPGSAPVALTSPGTGTVMGSLVVKADGGVVFKPAPGYVGTVPVVNLFLRSSSEQSFTSTLVIDVLSRKLQAGGSSPSRACTCMHARVCLANSH
jgi:hypothetical protein